MQKILITLGLIALGTSLGATAAPFTGKVVKFVDSDGFGVFKQSQSRYQGISGKTIDDSDALLAPDSGGTPGAMTLLLKQGDVLDGPGADQRIYDSLGLSEAIKFGISFVGAEFYSVFSQFGINNTKKCNSGSSCATEIFKDGVPSSMSFSFNALPADFGHDAEEALIHSPGTTVLAVSNAQPEHPRPVSDTIPPTSGTVGPANTGVEEAPSVSGDKEVVFVPIDNISASDTKPLPEPGTLYLLSLGVLIFIGLSIKKSIRLTLMSRPKWRLLSL